MKRWLLAGALAYAAAGQALASDLPPPVAPPPARAPAVYIPPAVAAVYNWGGIYCIAASIWASDLAPAPAINDWTGIYLGGRIGGGMLVDSPAQTGISTGGFGPASVGKFAAGRRDRWRPDRSPNSRPGSSAWKLRGPLRRSVGLDWMHWTLRDRSHNVPSERFTSAAQWFAALTRRVGHAANDWLFYAKGSGAWMNVRYTEDLLTTAGSVTAATQALTDNRTGFTVGAGVEFGLVENLSGKIE